MLSHLASNLCSRLVLCRKWQIFGETNNAKSDKNSTKVNGHEEVAVIGSNEDNLHPDISFYGRGEDDKVFRGDDKLYRGDDKVYRGEDKLYRGEDKAGWRLQPPQDPSSTIPLPSPRGLASSYQVYVQPYPSIQDGTSLHSSTAPLHSLQRSNQQLYNQLQFPVTSNYGSMKKKKKDSLVTVNGRHLTQSASMQDLQPSQDVSSSQISLVNAGASQVSLGPTQMSLGPTQMSLGPTQMSLGPSWQQTEPHPSVLYVPELFSLAPNANTNTKV